MLVRRVTSVVVAVAILCGCSGSVPSLLDGRDHLVVSGKAYRFRIPIAGCGAPVVSVNGKHWEPEPPPASPFPAAWHTHESGQRYHTTTYATGTMRLVGGVIEVEFRGGTVIRYRFTTKPYPSNVCA